MIGRTNKLPFNPINWSATPHDNTGDYQLAYYTTETTQRYVWGTRGLTWDGKVFRYSRSKDTLYAGYGALNGASVDVSDLINSNHTLTISPGDREVLVTVAAGEGYDNGAVAEDELVGAMFVVGHGAAATTETRTVIGNEYVAAAGGTIMVEVDYPFALTHTTGFMELPLNPYGYLLKPANQVGSVMGVPNITATTGQNLWIQTWGLCWCVPGGADADIASEAANRECVFVGDGSVNGSNIITLENGYQRAGFVTDSSEAGTGCMPMVMLQISI
jgi:hypothetical protein